MYVLHTYISTLFFCIYCHIYPGAPNSAKFRWVVAEGQPRFDKGGGGGGGGCKFFFTF